MANVFNPIAKTFAFQIKNHYSAPKYIALFSGTIDTYSIAREADTSALVLTPANPLPVKNYAQTQVDAVLTDGVLPEMAGDVLTIPSAKSGSDYLEARSLNPQFRITDLKSWLRSNRYDIKRIIIKVQSQDQFDNPITFQTSNPTENAGAIQIQPTNYSDPSMLNTTKIIIDDIEGTKIQDDCMMFWQINSGEVVNITMEFTEHQGE